MAEDDSGSGPKAQGDDMSFLRTVSKSKTSHRTIVKEAMPCIGAVPSVSLCDNDT